LPGRLLHGAARLPDPGLLRQEIGLAVVKGKLSSLASLLLAIPWC